MKPTCTSPFWCLCRCVHQAKKEFLFLLRTSVPVTKFCSSVHEKCIKDVIKTNNSSSLQVSEDEITKLCSVAGAVFQTQPSLIEVEPPVVVCGDIHGQVRNEQMDPWRFELPANLGKLDKSIRRKNSALFREEGKMRFFSFSRYDPMLSAGRFTDQVFRILTVWRSVLIYKCAENLPTAFCER